MIEEGRRYGKLAGRDLGNRRGIEIRRPAAVRTDNRIALVTIPERGDRGRGLPFPDILNGLTPDVFRLMLNPHRVVEVDDAVAHRIAQVRSRLADTLGPADRHGRHAVGVGELPLRQTGAAVGLREVGRGLPAGKGREVIGGL